MFVEFSASAKNVFLTHLENDKKKSQTDINVDHKKITDGYYWKVVVISVTRF